MLPLLSATPAVTLVTLEGCHQFRCLVNRGTMGVNSLPKNVTRQRRGCDLTRGPYCYRAILHVTKVAIHATIARTLNPVAYQFLLG